MERPIAFPVSIPPAPPPPPGWARMLKEVSHQVRTPMNGILGMTQLLLSSGLERHQRQMAQVVLDSSRNLLGLLQEVLDLAQVETGSMDLREDPVELHALLDEVAWRTICGAPPACPAVETRMAPSLPPVILADARRLRQVLLSILHSAARTASGGRLGLRVRPGRVGAPPMVVFEVAARPAGAPPDVDLFLPLYPEEGEPLLPREGQVPGLSLSREWVQKMGGKLGAGNRADGGIWTWFSLAMRTPDAGGSPPPLPDVPVTMPAPAPAESDGNPVRILVVEDNPINQRVFESMLEHLGYGCRIVANGQEALAALTAERYDLVFMDCQMPVMDGYEATRRVRAGLPHAGPIVAMTAHALDGDREKCLEAGMDDYLAKPVSLKNLGRMLDKWLKPARTD